MPKSSHFYLNNWKCFNLFFLLLFVWLQSSNLIKECSIQKAFHLLSRHNLCCDCHWCDCLTVLSNGLIIRNSLNDQQTHLMIYIHWDSLDSIWHCDEPTRFGNIKILTTQYIFDTLFVWQFAHHLFAKK